MYSEAGPREGRPTALVVVHVAGALGGAERTTVNLLSRLDRARFDPVRVIASALLRPALEPLSDTFVEAESLRLEGWFTTPARLRADATRLRAHLREWGPAVVLGMMHYGAAMAVGATRGLGMPVVASFRGPAYEYLRRYARDWREHGYTRLAIAHTARKAARVTVPSRGTGRELVRRFLAPPGRIRVVANGIDLEDVARRARRPIPDGLPHRARQRVICTAARLCPEKDLGALLHALRRVRQRHEAILWILGEGPERAALGRLAGTLGVVEAVHFLGYRDEVFPYLAAAEIYVHTCEFEGFGYAPLEAMACGVPVVAMDCPYGPREVLDEGRAGQLVPPGDVAALARALSRLLDDPARAGELRRRGLERARALSIEAMVEGQTAVLEEAARERIHARR